MAQLVVRVLRVGGGVPGFVTSCCALRMLPGPCPRAVAHLALFQIVLQQVAAVVHGLGGLDLEVDALRELVDLAEDLLEFLAAEQIVQLAAAHRNQEEDIPHHDGELLEQIAEVVEVVGVVAADGGVHLDGNAGLVGPLDGLDGARPGAGQAAEGVVNLGG